MAGISSQILVGIPGAIGACIAVWKARLPVGPRRHQATIERLAKVVDAAGDDCPRPLKVKLNQEIHWLAATYAVQPRRSESVRARVLAGTVVVTYVVAAFAISLLFHGSWVQWPVTSASIIVATGCLMPAWNIAGWVRVQSRLYAMLGGNPDLPEIPRPSLIPFVSRVPNSREVDRWIDSVFRGVAPLPSSVRPSHLAQLRVLIEEWDRRRWYRRSKSKVR